MNNEVEDNKVDIARRFVGVHNLYGAAAYTALSDAQVYVIGVGGVGSWAAEFLARTGVGYITLVDMDVVAESNINRQLVALTDTLGEDKIAVMRARIAQINPKCTVRTIDELLTPQNVADILPAKAPKRPTVILDCTDDMHAKVAIALHCRFNKLKLITAGAAGAKTDPTQLAVCDLKDTYQDPLLAKLRDKLRALGINQSAKEKFGIVCVFCAQAPTQKSCNSSLSCTGYGSAVVLTAGMATMMVSEAIARLIR